MSVRFESSGPEYNRSADDHMPLPVGCGRLQLEVQLPVGCGAQAVQLTRSFYTAWMSRHEYNVSFSSSSKSPSEQTTGFQSYSSTDGVQPLVSQPPQLQGLYTYGGFSQAALFSITDSPDLTLNLLSSESCLVTRYCIVPGFGETS